MPDRPTAERGHLPASIFERNRVLRRRNHPKTSENLIFCELRNFNSETSSHLTLPVQTSFHVTGPCKAWPNTGSDLWELTCRRGGKPWSRRDPAAHNVPKRKGRSAAARSINSGGHGAPACRRLLTCPRPSALRVLGDRVPYPPGRRGHREICYAERRERIEYCIHDRCRCADRARLATALGAERVVRAERLMGGQVKNWNVVGAGQAIVHQRASSELTALGIIDRVFMEGLTNALDQPAVHLALDNQRIDDAAEIIGSREIQQRDLAGVSIDLDLGDVRPGGIGEIRRIVKRSLVETGLDSVDGIVVRHIGRQGDLGKRYGFV